MGKRPHINPPGQRRQPAPKYHTKGCSRSFADSLGARTLVFAAFEPFHSCEFRASIARTPFCAILWRSPKSPLNLTLSNPQHISAGWPPQSLSFDLIIDPDLQQPFSVFLPWFGKYLALCCTSSFLQGVMQLAAGIFQKVYEG